MHASSKPNVLSAHNIRPTSLIAGSLWRMVECGPPARSARPRCTCGRLFLGVRLALIVRLRRGVRGARDRDRAADAAERMTGVPNTAIVTSMITTRRIVAQPTACVTGEMFESARNCTSEYAVK